MADIKFYIEQIQRAIYGEEVRSSIANALTVVNEDNNGQQALRDEVIHARDDMYDYVNDFNEKMNIADITKQQLVDATHSAEGSREQLNQSIKESSETEITLNEIVRIAEKSRNELDKSNLIAGNTKTQLDNIVKKAAYLDDNLADKIQEGNKLKTDLPVLISNEVKKITDAGTEEVRKVTETGDTVSQLIDGFDYKVTEVMSTIIEQGNTSIKAVADKGAEQTGNVTAEGTKQTEAVQAKGQEVINSIPEDFTTQMGTKLDKQQGTENAGKALVIGDDGNVVPGEVQSRGMKLLVRYTHNANGSMKLSNLDLQTGIFTTSEPHGLRENTALYIKPLAGCYPKHIPIEIFKNNPGQWGRGNIYAHVIDETHFQILSKKDGDILLFTDSANSEVDVKYFTFEYNMKKITFDNINSRVIDVVANGICSGGYFTVRATTNYGNTYSTRISSNTYAFNRAVGQVSQHYQYACRMLFDKGIVTSTIPIVAMAVDGTSYVNNNINKIGRAYTQTVIGMGMVESNPNEEKENGYIKSIQPFADEVYPFNGAYVEIWGYEE